MTEQDVMRLADRLLRTTTETAIYRDNEGTEARHFWQEPPLFVLLRNAARPDMGNRPESGGGGGAGGSAAAISVEAVDLFVAIDRESAELMWLERERLRVRPMATMEQRVLAWVEFMRTKPTGRLEVRKVLAKWVTQIEGLLDPAKVLQLRGACCPECRNTWAMVHEFGETIRKPALAAAVGSEQVLASCRACGAEWPASSIHDLADTLNAQSA
ncbi:hypothetical protein [Arthrobacter sp. JSM 101049]|uniref:hypothetical protein n=1 Tax=Arthrobacter sp. JSM 101049 TaxID=929097 RepID=UPI00356586D5